MAYLVAVTACVSGVAHTYMAAERLEKLCQLEKWGVSIETQGALGTENPLVMGNWKLNGSRHMVHELVSNLRKELAGVAGCAVAIAPPEMYIDMAKREAEGSHIMLGAQNVDLNLSGAFTGETSAAMLKDIGAQYIIIGHSERRTYHKESDELIAKKFEIGRAHV